MRRVLIVQRRLTNYRVPLFQRLRDELEKRSVDLRLAVGSSTASEESKKDGGELAWAEVLPTRYWLNGRACWQPFGRLAGEADLVIVTQENKLLYNHWLVFRPHDFRLAFWGHGRNWQGPKRHALRERFKRWESKQVDWWFAYTERSAQAVEAMGFPRERISILNNAIDTSSLKVARESISTEDLKVLRQHLGWCDAPAGVFIGSLYREKRLDFLFATAREVRRQIPDFKLVVIGDGPDRAMVRSVAASESWVYWPGSLKGRDKALHALLGDVVLMPGLVGLSILDAFVLELPMITTPLEWHSPEIEYLEDGENGVVAQNDPEKYADEVVAVVRDRARLERLREGCRASADQYTLEGMVTRFCQGICSALEALD